MPLTPTKIKTMTYATAFEYMGETVNLEYRPTALRNTTQAELDAFREAAAKATEENQDQVLQDFGEWIVKILASWDLLESMNDDGSPGPTMAITPENVAMLCQECGDFMVRVVQAIYDDFNAKNGTGTAS